MMNKHFWQFLVKSISVLCNISSSSIKAFITTVAFDFESGNMYFYMVFRMTFIVVCVRAFLAFPQFWIGFTRRHQFRYLLIKSNEWNDILRKRNIFIMKKVFIFHLKYLSKLSFTSFILVSSSNLIFWFGLVWFGLVWFGLEWFGLFWFDLVWFGWVWYGMVWVGLV